MTLDYGRLDDIKAMLQGLDETDLLDALQNVIDEVHRLHRQYEPGGGVPAAIAAELSDLADWFNTPGPTGPHPYRTQCGILLGRVLNGEAAMCGREPDHPGGDVPHGPDHEPVLRAALTHRHPDGTEHPENPLVPCGVCDTAIIRRKGAA